MSLLDDLRNIDPRDPGRWPLAVSASAVGIVFLVLSAVATYMLVYTNQDPQLQSLESQEESLRAEFRQKHSKATNLEIYKQQLADISQTGLASALDQKLFQPEGEVKKEFYAERPIKIRFVGSYHQFGQFVSGVASLPRIVTLHDVQISQMDKGGFDHLQMDLTAKTYRYLDDEEVAAAESERRKAEQAKHTPAAKGGEG